MWKTEEDVLSTLDEVSVFTKNQESIRRLRIKSSKTEYRKKLKDSKRKEEHAGKVEEDTERNGVCTGDSDNISNYSSLEVSDINSMPVAAGRAQQISHYKQLKQSLSRENYIHREVQRAAGSYSNDLIEQNWRASVNLNRNLDPEAAGKISEDPDGQFDNAEDAEDNNSLISSLVSKSDELSSKGSPTKELSSAEESGETCDSESRTSLTSTIDETNPTAPIQPSTETRPPIKTKPPRQRNALLLSLQRKITTNESSLETDKKGTVCENSAVVEAEKKDSTCEDSAILEDNKKDSTNEKSAVSNEDCENGNVECRLNNPSTIVEFKPSINTALACNPSTHMAYNPGSDVECNPDVSVDHSCGTSVEYDLNTRGVHYPDMGLECYPNMGAGYYPNMSVEQYSNMSVEQYSSSAEHYPNTRVESYPVGYYSNPNVTYYPSTSGVYYPGTGEEYNLINFTVNSIGYVPVHSGSDITSDPLFAPTNENMVTEFKYREEEFPPL